MKQLSSKTIAGPAENFTGTVFMNSIRTPDEQTAVGAAHVHFLPGARTNWHRHPKGQTLYVTDGVGYVGLRDGTVITIRPGDSIYTEPNEEHWHGATKDQHMAHIALQEADENGEVVTWLEPVADTEYK